jgi:hypothetical protein
LAEGNDPIVQHGAALGLGVAGIATGDEGELTYGPAGIPANKNTEIYEELRTALFQDNATAGEAAGYALGLIMLGSASEKALEEMISYARETQHEKIIRSLAVGIAFVMYGTRERADGIIQALMEEKVSIYQYYRYYHEPADIRLLHVYRTRSCDLEQCTLSPSLMLELVATKQFESCYTLRSQTSMTMCDELLLRLLDSFSSEITFRFHGSCNCWQRVTIHMSVTVLRWL